MARGEVQPLLSKEFVELKIDTDRMVGGADMLKAQRKAAGLEEGGGIPWIVFFDAGGTALATSEGPAGNIGCPYADEEIAHFVTMLEKAPAQLTPEDVAALKASLVAVRLEDEAKKKAREAAGGR